MQLYEAIFAFIAAMGILIIILLFNTIVNIRLKKSIDRANILFQQLVDEKIKEEEKE